MFDNLKLKLLVLHWNSKILPDITGKSMVDRIPVVHRALNSEQLLGVPEIISGTGREISSAIYYNLQEWSLAVLQIQFRILYLIQLQII